MTRYNPDLHLDDPIVVQFSIPSDPKPLRFIAQVARISNLPDNKQEIALQFKSISEAQQNQITKYLFTKQRMERVKVPHPNFPVR